MHQIRNCISNKTGTQLWSLQCRCPAKIYFSKHSFIDRRHWFNWSDQDKSRNLHLKSMLGFCRIPTMYEIRLSLWSMCHVSSFLCCPQVDKLEEAESQRKTEEEVTEPQPMVFGRFTGSTPPWGAQTIVVLKLEKIALCCENSCSIYLSVCEALGKNSCWCSDSTETKCALTGWK